MLRVCFICTNLFDCSGSVQPHPVLNFRGLQHESIRHIHAQHSHYFRKTPFFKTKQTKRTRKHRLGAAVVLSARCVCKSQSRLGFHVNCLYSRLALPSDWLLAGQGTRFCALIGGKFLKLHNSGSNGVGFCNLIGGKFVAASYIFYFPGKVHHVILEKRNKNKITHK